MRKGRKRLLIVGFGAGVVFVLLTMLYLKALLVPTGLENRREELHQAVESLSVKISAIQPPTTPSKAEEPGAETPPAHSAPEPPPALPRADVQQIINSKGQLLIGTPLADLAQGYFMLGVLRIFENPPPDSVPIEAGYLSQSDAADSAARRTTSQYRPVSGEYRELEIPMDQLLQGLDESFFRVPTDFIQFNRVESMVWTDQRRQMLMHAAILQEFFAGDRQRGLDLLDLYAANSLRAHVLSFEHSFSGPVYPLWQLIMVLDQAGELEEPDLQRLQSIVAGGYIDEAAEAELRKASILRGAEDFKQHGFVSSGNTWGYFLDGKPRGVVAAALKPVADRDVDRVAAALLSGNKEDLASAHKGLAIRLALMNCEDRTYAYMHPPFEDTKVPPVLTELFPYIRSEILPSNRAVEGLDLALAILRYRKLNGTEPTSVEEVSSLLSDSFTGNGFWLPLQIQERRILHYDVTPLAREVDAYNAAHRGMSPSTPEDLRPYVTDPERLPLLDEMTVTISRDLALTVLTNKYSLPVPEEIRSDDSTIWVNYYNDIEDRRQYFERLAKEKPIRVMCTFMVSPDPDTLSKVRAMFARDKGEP
jgi:hypothetical protein